MYTKHTHTHIRALTEGNKNIHVQNLMVPSHLIRFRGRLIIKFTDGLEKIDDAGDGDGWLV